MHDTNRLHVTFSSKYYIDLGFFSVDIYENGRKLSINFNDRKQPFLDHQVSLDHPWFEDHWLKIDHFFWEKLNVPFWNASVTPHYHCKLFCKLCSKNYPWNRISERTSCLESVIVPENVAYMAQLEENHLAYQQISKKW